MTTQTQQYTWILIVDGIFLLLIAIILVTIMVSMDKIKTTIMQIRADQRLERQNLEQAIMFHRMQQKHSNV